MRRRRHPQRNTPSFFFPPLKVVFFRGTWSYQLRGRSGRIINAYWLRCGISCPRASLISHAILLLRVKHKLPFPGAVGLGVPERRVGGLVQGFVSEQGGARRGHVVLQVGGDVLGGGSAEQFQPLLQDLLPTLQRFQHGVAQGGGHGQICSGGERKQARAKKDTIGLGGK